VDRYECDLIHDDDDDDDDAKIILQVGRVNDMGSCRGGRIDREGWGESGILARGPFHRLRFWPGRGQPPPATAYP
jgi:hypothetical protein